MQTIGTSIRNKAKRVTISDLSDALGLTKGTVSRALNGYPDIAEATRLRVSKMAKKMGYAPLAHAQAIRTGRTRSIGLVVQTGDHDGSSPFLADFLAGISRAASAEGWTLTVATSEDEADTLDKIKAVIRDRKADGFILPRTRLSDPRIDLLRAEEIPFVLFGRTADPTDCSWFDIKGEAAIHEAVTRLAALGHHRIAFVNGGDGYTYAALRKDGYVSGLNEAGLLLDPSLIEEDAVTQDAGQKAAAHFLMMPEPPTAIIYATDKAALGAYDAARSLGLQIGADVSIIAYDGIPEGAYLSPNLSTYSVRHREAGEILAQMLVRRVRGERADALRQTAFAEFLDRGSCGAALLGSHDLAKKIRHHAGQPNQTGGKE